MDDAFKKAETLLELVKPAEIAKYTGATRQAIYKLKSGKSDITKATYSVVEGMVRMYDNLHRSEQIDELAAKWRSNWPDDADPVGMATRIWELTHQAPAKSVDDIVKKIETVEHGNGYDEYQTTYLVDQDTMEGLIGRHTDPSDEFPPDHYYAEALAKIVDEVNADEVLLHTGLFLFRGRKGAVNMAFEKLLWQLNQSEEDPDNDYIQTLIIKGHDSGRLGEVLRIDTDIDTGYRLTITTMAY